MTLLALVAGAALMQSPPPAPDRSGEPALRKILAWAKGLDQVHLVILKKTRENALAPMYPDSRVDLWLAGPKFRMETSGYWGDGSVIVCDGTFAMSDAQDESQPVIVADAKGSPMATLMDLKVPVEEISPLFGFMGGPEILDKLVEKTAAIKQEPDSQGEKVLSFSNKRLGGVKLLYREDKQGVRLDRIDFDNLTWLREQHEKFPDWWDEPDPGTLTRNDLIVRAEKINGSLFSTKPAKGRIVEDKRKKKTG